MVINKRLRLSLLFLAVGTLAALVFYFVTKKPSIAPAPVVKELVRLSGKVASSTARARTELKRLDALWADRSGVPKIDAALTQLPLTRAAVIESYVDIDAFRSYLNKAIVDLRGQALAGAKALQLIYDHDTQVRHRRALIDLLGAAEVFLRFLRDNLKAVKAGQKAGGDRYKVLRQKWRAAIDRHNRAYLAKIKFIEQVAKRHPELGKIVKSVMDRKGR